jgi:CHAT domain-containing protein
VRFLELLRYRSLLATATRGVTGVRPHALPEIRSALEEGTAIVEYIAHGRSMHALVITSSGVRKVALPVSSDAVGTKIRLLRSLMFENPRLADWIDVASDLRRVLVTPLEAAGALDGVTRLEIVPWGAMRDLPFGVLRSERRFLVEDYVIAHAPSASAAVRARRAGDGGGRPVAFGLARFSDAELPALPQAEGEARAVAASVGGDVRLGASATVDELMRVAPNARALHFATHAVTEPEMPMMSRLALAPGGGDDGSLTIDELLALELRAGLVTLGACRTGESHGVSGRVDADLERVGLVEAFLHAGARAVLASLAPVGDRSTAIFMRRYYAAGVPQDPAARLAEVQRELIRGVVPEVRHPRHWGAFVVYGGAP